MEKLKFIIDELNKIFASDYNCASFNSLSQTQLLQVLVDVMVHLGIAEHRDVRSSKENCIYDVLVALEAIKYAPDREIDPSVFREGLADADKAVMYPILYFLLSNADNVKERFYLSKYVNRIEISAEDLEDMKLTELYNRYNNFIEEFWKIYKENRKQKKFVDECTELNDDIFQMKSDMTNLRRRLQQQNCQLKQFNVDKEEYLEAVKGHCNEMKKGAKFQTQLFEETDRLLEHKEVLRRLLQRDKIRNLQDILEKSEHHKIAEDTIAVASKQVETELSLYEKVTEDDYPNELELRGIQEIMMELQSDIEELNNEKEQVCDTAMEAYLNQTKALSKKKAMLSKQVTRLKLVNDSVLIKIQDICVFLGGDVLHGKNLKEYIAQLRQMSINYKQHKQFLNSMQSECGLLERTKDILYMKNPEIKEKIKAIENLAEESDNLTENESKKRFKYILSEYKKLHSEACREQLKFDKIKSLYNELQKTHRLAEQRYLEANGSLKDEVEKLTAGYEEIQELIQMELEDLRTYVDEAEDLKDKLMVYSQEIIENAGEIPYVDQVQQNLVKVRKERDVLRKDLESRQEEINSLFEEMDHVKNVISMVQQKLNEELI